MESGRPTSSIFSVFRESGCVSWREMKKTLTSEVEKFFRPEFINRLDDMIVFRPLIKPDLTHIIDLEMAKVRDRLKARGMVQLGERGAITPAKVEEILRLAA